ncbi:hypothetical protein [Streptomyces sp. NPDC006355]|uniref:hypothetical protein n=1 Tax=Streptomyces sp. NPDC006355 TaxID=3156758 RepID=UPI0033A45FE4
MTQQDLKGKAEAAAKALAELLDIRGVEEADRRLLGRALQVVWEIRDEASAEG